MRDPLSKRAAVGTSILGGIILAQLADARGEAKKAASISQAANVLRRTLSQCHPAFGQIGNLPILSSIRGGWNASMGNVR